MHIRVSAPGKLVLIGEYSVLFGAPAAVIAVNRRTNVELAPSMTARWSVDSPGLTSSPFEFDLDFDGSFRWDRNEHEASTRFDLVERVVQGLIDAEVVRIGALDPAAMTLDTRPFFAETTTGIHKLGLGSSAALTVAMATALIAWSGGKRQPNSMWLRTLIDLHRRVQGGHGSGIDIAAGLLGGVVRFQLGLGGTVASASSLDLPDDLHLVCIWTGRSASTGAFLTRLEARRAEDPQVVNKALDRLAAVSAEGIDALENRQCASFFDAVSGFWEGLENLGSVIGLPILSDEHRRLHRLAEECGAHYKPSGAGGGDIGLALSSDSGAVECVKRRASAEGFVPLDLEVDGKGVSASV